MSSFERTKFRILFFSSRDEGKIESARVRIAEECQRACVREICIADQVPNNVGGKKRASGLSVGKEFDDAGQSFSSCQYGSKSSLCFVPKVARPPSLFTQTRDTRTARPTSVPGRL